MEKSLRGTLLSLLIGDLEALQMRIHKFIQGHFGFWPYAPTTSKARHNFRVFCGQLSEVGRSHACFGQECLNLGKQFGVMSVFHAA